MRRFRGAGCIRLWCPLVCVLAVGGCVSTHHAFAPTEEARDHTTEGHRQATYELSDGGRRYGVVKVWSRGARRATTEGGHRTVVHVGFTIENLGKGPLQLDVSRVRLESIEAGASRKLDARPGFVHGDPVVAAGHSGRLELEFGLPSDVLVDDLRAFRVKWTAHNHGHAFTEITPFAPFRETYAYRAPHGYYGYYGPRGFYDPWLYPGYGPLFYGYYRPPVVIVRPASRRARIQRSPVRRRRSGAP